MTAYVKLFQIGTRVSCSPPYAGKGIIFAIHGVQVPESVRSMGGVGVAGGNAHVDVVFSNGHVSRHLSECLVRASCQWSVSDEVASAHEIEAALKHADQVQAAREATKREQEAQFSAEVERLKSAPEYARLTQGDDIYSGALAAKNIRVMLKSSFPGVKFSVRKTSFGSLHIEWVDGPIENDVQAVAGLFRAGRFCSEDDSYQYEKTPWCAVFGSVEYIQYRRQPSAELIERAVSQVFTEFAGNFSGIEQPTAEQYQRGQLDLIRVPGLPFTLQQLTYQAINRTAC